MSTALTVTPGYTVSDETNVDAAVLNALGRPTVSIPDNTIPPASLQMTQLAQALLDSAGDSLRGRNFLTKTNFWAEEWTTPEGITVTDGNTGENAAEWTAKPTGGSLTVARVVDSPDALSTWGSQLTGGTGMTSCDYYTWVPSGLAGSLRDSTLTFSIWIKNLSAATAFVQAFIAPSGAINSRAEVIEADASALQSFLAGAWTRLVWTFETNGMADLPNGFRIGIRTAFLSSPLRSLIVAQAQLEQAEAVTDYMRPPAGAGQGFRVPQMTEAERAGGALLLVQLTSGEWRTLPAPTAAQADAPLAWDPSVGVPQWVGDGFRTYRYSGADQILTIPEGITSISIHAWGAGAAPESSRPGGVGGYTYGTLAVTPGAKYAIVVGQGGVWGSSAAVYGFGGPGTAVEASGGGLSGVFTGETPVVATDTARAVLIAGGGGGCSFNQNQPNQTPTTTAGGNGNDPSSSGGYLSMLGVASEAAQGVNAGGGGYVGGSNIGAAGRGGSAFRHGDLTDAGEEYTARTTPVSAGQVLTVPGNTNPLYQDQAGQTGKHGLVVIVFNPPVEA